MTIDRDALVEKGLAAAIDKPSATTPDLIQFGSHMPDDVEDLRAIVVDVLDAILPDVQADAWDEGATVGWNEALIDGDPDPLNPYRKVASE